MSDNLAMLRARNLAVWSAGDWDAMAEFIASAGPRLLDRLPVGPGTSLLDVGTGSGTSVAIPAAQRGAEVTGSDITDAWFPAARRNADEAGVDVQWLVGDAMELPIPDDAFDVVTSTFGHMFAPDHATAASELARVCRPGGTVGLACWTPEGTVGQMFIRLGGHMPPPPEGFQPPPLWGVEAHVRGLLEPLGFELELRRENIVMTFPSVEEQSDHMERNFGPMVTAKAALGDGWPAVRADFREFMTEMNEADDGSVVTTNEYLEIVGTLAE
ncbi:MAG: class I SAM-dependent methyltransferase [Solirubrobacteraceae bacterium]